MSLREVQEEIAISLNAKPCSFDNLIKRDFLLQKSKYGIQILIEMMLSKKVIYERNGALYTYKANAKNLLIE